MDLTAEQFDQYSQLAGKAAKAAIEQEMRSPAWRSLSDEERREFVKETLEDSRSAARETLIERYGLAGAPQLLRSNRVPASPLTRAVILGLSFRKSAKKTA